MATVSRYETAGGTRWRVRYRTPDNRQTDKRGFTTKREAESFAATLEVAKMRGEYVAPKLGKVTVGELGPAWLQRQQGHMKPSGFRSYASVWKNHVEPRWGTKRINDIRFSDVQGWVSELSARRSPTIVKLSHLVLGGILNDAVKDRLLVSNPAVGVKLPKQVRHENTYLTRDQLDLLAEESGRYRSLVLLLGVGGLRWSEAAALRVSDIDFLRRRITLHHSVVRVGPEFVVGTLKSGKSRSVVLPQPVIDALAQSVQGKGRDNLMWTTATGGYLGTPTHTSWFYSAVRRCMKADPTFPRITAHSLRHTAASLAISAGANPKVVQRMLGHASAAMTLDIYGHLFDADLEAVAETVGKLWAKDR